MNLKKRNIAYIGVALLIFAAAANAATIDTVTVGNPGNAADSNHFGAVSYTYDMGKYEITAGQYGEFLNAVAKSDMYGLYDQSWMEMPNSCNIKRDGLWGSYSYSVAADWANRPVNYIDWGSAARFCNWLANGQPKGTQDLSTTEDGSYFLNGKVDNNDLMTVMRKPDATWVIPTLNEWYKAAYHKNDGVTGNYFDYPTGSDIAPSNILGNPTDPGNNATFYKNGFTIGGPYYRTEVGAHENSESPYGTFDQGGNVSEWYETAYNTGRIYGGGYFGDYNNDLASNYSRYYRDPGFLEYYIGFRVALVPEPSIFITMIGVAVTSLLYYWRRNS